MEAKSQLSLFSSKATARRDHPQASKDAANALNNSGATPEHESDVLKALRKYPYSTAKILGARMAQDMFTKAGIDLTLDIILEAMYIGSQPHKRLSQMGDTVIITEMKPEKKYRAR